MGRRRKTSSVSIPRTGLLGRKRLDEVKHEDIQKLKAKLVHLNPKTVNGILGVLSKLLKVAVDWQRSAVATSARRAQNASWAWTTN